MDSLVLVIFGITSNLAQIKLIPALYDMAKKGLLPENMTIIGNARSPKTKQQIEDFVHEVLHFENKHHKHEIEEPVFKSLISKVHYVDGHLDNPNFYTRLNDQIKILSQGQNTNVIYYLATYPELYHYILESLNSHGMNSQNAGWVRLMIEKPIGNDLESARKLNALLTQYFTEDQIYRLDHYLGKETLQNILAFRFGNGIFEPLINREHIDHIQITAAEDYGIGKRGGYYDGVGALKDVGQNHQLQMLAFATMDAPSEFSNRAVTDARIKILKALKPGKVIFGQYKEYHQEENVKLGSDTDTYYALKCEIDNERFRGVPIYIRAGKKMKETVTEISVVFKVPEYRLLHKQESSMYPNILIYRIQPNEGIVLKILTKKPGHKVELEEQFMQFCYRIDPHQHALPDPYERLLSDAIRGDQTFFNDAEEVEASWTFIDPLIASKTKVFEYEPGSWGPKEADKLLEDDGRSWLTPSMDFCRI